MRMILVFMDKVPFNAMWLRSNYRGQSVSVKKRLRNLGALYNVDVPFAPLEGTAPAGMGGAMPRSAGHEE